MGKRASWRIPMYRMGRQRTLQLLIVLFILTLPVTVSSKELVILHTNDLHVGIKLPHARER